MRTDNEAIESSEFWMRCPSKPGNRPTPNDIPTDRPKVKHDRDEEPSGADSAISMTWITILLIVIANRIAINNTLL